MLLHLNYNYLERNFLFLYLSIRCKTVKKFSTNPRKLRNNLPSSQKVLSLVPLEVIWYNKYRKIDSNAIYNRYFSKKSIYHTRDLFESNGTTKSWEELKLKYDFDRNRKFYWIQIPKVWGKNFRHLVTIVLILLYAYIT